MNDAQSHQELLVRYLDGNLRQEEEAQVADLLRSDPVARAFLREVAEQAVTVADVERAEQGRRTELAARKDWARVGNETFGRTESPRTRLAKWPFALAAATAVVALIAGVLFSRANVQPEIAQITELGGAVQWTGDGGRVVRDLAVGSSLRGGTLESLSADSWGTLEFRDGSTVTVSGQSMLTISERRQKEWHLKHGRLSASVTTQPVGKPMLIYTPMAELEVLGTQFNVDAESSATILAVNEGLVRLKRLTDGKVIEVPAEHQVHTSIDEQNGLTVTSLNSATYSWRSDLARDAMRGKWTSDLQSLGVKLKKAVISGKLTKEEAKAKYKAAANLNDETGILYATPWLVKHSKSGTKADVSYLAMVSVMRGQAVPVVLDAGSRFRVQGRLESSADVTFGMTTNAPGGGFAGKYSAARTIEISEADGNFDIEIPLSEFRTVALKKWSSMSPIGHELADWWCFTTDTDVGLAITHIELLPPASAP